MVIKFRAWKENRRVRRVCGWTWMRYNLCFYRFPMYVTSSMLDTFHFCTDKWCLAHLDYYYYFSLIKLSLSHSSRLLISSFLVCIWMRIQIHSLFLSKREGRVSTMYHVNDYGLFWPPKIYVTNCDTILVRKLMMIFFFFNVLNGRISYQY